MENLIRIGLEFKTNRVRANRSLADRQGLRINILTVYVPSYLNWAMQFRAFHLVWIQTI